MNWFNYYGLAFLAPILIPNIIYAFLHKDGFQNAYKNKTAEALEQVGRYGCMVFMIFNIPYTCFNFWFEHALIVYLCGNGILLLAYWAGWIFFRNKTGMARAVWLSVFHSAIFLYSGILLANIPLIVFALLFSVNHILISCLNAK